MILFGKYTTNNEIKQADQLPSFFLHLCALCIDVYHDLKSNITNYLVKLQ